MIARTTRIKLITALLMAAFPAGVHAQDVPGIEICTVEKTMERRTSCLQSNVDFLQKTITKLTSDHQQKLDAANRQIEALKSAVVGPAEDRQPSCRRRRARRLTTRRRLLRRLRRMPRRQRTVRSSSSRSVRTPGIAP